MSICLALTEPNWAVTKDVFSIIGTFVSASGVGVALWIGRQGLETWRRQQKGTNDHTLAKQLLLDIYKLRQLLKDGRIRTFTTSEVADLPKSITDAGGGGLNFRVREYAFRVREDRINASVIALKVDALEAEALWGDEVHPYISNIEKIANEICNYIGMYIYTKNPELDDDDLASAKEYFQSLRPVFISYPHKNLESFNADFESAFKQAGEYLKSKMLIG